MLVVGALAKQPAAEKLGDLFFFPCLSIQQPARN